MKKKDLERAKKAIEKKRKAEQNPQESIIKKMRWICRGFLVIGGLNIIVANLALSQWQVESVSVYIAIVNLIIGGSSLFMAGHVHGWIAHTKTIDNIALQVILEEKAREFSEGF